MTTENYVAEEIALMRAINRLPRELFTAHRRVWNDTIGLALLDAVYSLQVTYRANHPEHGIESRIIRFVEEHPSAKNDLNALAEVPQARVRDLMGFGKTGVTLKSEAVMDVARRLPSLERPIVRAGDVTADRLSDVQRVYTSVAGLGKAAFRYFTLSLAVPAATAGPLLTRFVAREAYGDEALSPNSAEVLALVDRAYQQDSRGAETLSQFQHALWLAERNGPAP